MAEADQNTPEAQQEAPQAVFNIEKLYLKDVSLEIPNAPQVFTVRETPQIGIELQHKSASIDDGIFEVTVTVTVTAKLQNTTAFLIEVAQAGIFQIRNVPLEGLEGLLGITCPNILFPYLREAVSDVSVRAGFAPVLLNPINFEALFMQQKQQQAAQTETTH
jgi:preprotein translocase subunit SecB